MTDERICHWTAVSGLTGFGVFLIDLPVCLWRGSFPVLAESWQLSEYAAQNAGSIVVCVLLDLLLSALLLFFAAGLRELIRHADPRQEGLSTLFFGISLLVVALTLVSDSLQVAAVVDWRALPRDGSMLRIMTESLSLMYWPVALFLMATLIGAAARAGGESRVLPGWAAKAGYLCAAACLALVPWLLATRPGAWGYNPSLGWGLAASVAGTPAALWMAAVSVALVRRRRAEGGAAVAQVSLGEDRRGGPRTGFRHPEGYGNRKEIGSRQREARIGV